MAQKTHAKGTQLYVDPDGGTSWDEIADVNAIMPPRKKRGTAETTVMMSPDDYREFIAGFKEGGEPTFKLRFTGDQLEDLDDIFEDGDKVPNWKITFQKIGAQVTAAQWIFLGVLTDLGMPEKSTDGENVWETECTIKVSGKPVFTKGA